MSNTTQQQVTNELLMMKMEELMIKMNELSIVAKPTVEIETKKSPISKRIIKTYNCDHCQKDTYIDSKGIEKKLTRRSRLNCVHGFCRPCLTVWFKDPENGDSCPVEDCIGKMPASKMEELLNPGAKGRKIAQKKKKEVKPEKVEVPETTVKLVVKKETETVGSPPTPEMENFDESDVNSLAEMLEGIDDSF